MSFSFQLKSSRNLKYKDFFDPVDGEAPGTGDDHVDSMDELQEDNKDESDEEENDSE